MTLAKIATPRRLTSFRAGTARKSPLRARASRLGWVPRWRAVVASVRARILGWFLLLLVLAVVGSMLLERQVLYARLDQRTTEELAQERDELLTLAAQGLDPETGRPFAHVGRVFDVFLERNIPADRETLIAFVDGRFHARSRQEQLHPIQDDPRIRALAHLRDSQRLDEITTPAGLVRYLAVPVGLYGEEPRGVFVVAQFVDRERQEIDAGLRSSGLIGMGTILLGSLFAWGAAGRVLAPLRLLTEAARSISDTDLTRRIPVRGADEISALAARFNDMLDRLDTAFATMRQFLDDAGHELRTPITVIYGHLELLDAGPDPQERAETIALVLDELDRMARIVDDLLLLAKAEQPDFLDPRPVDVATLTAELRIKAAALAERDWRLDEVGEGVIVADRHRLTQAVLQLAHNATQHTEQGMLITLGSRLQNGEARFWVRDSGPGVPPQDQARIFERFVRGSNGRRRSHGAGLGLSIVRAIAEAHHGRVEVDSSGQGATFTIVVPAEGSRTDARPMA